MANKLISQLTAGAANLQDVDQMEGQKSGELETKRFTGLQMRAVEKAEREAQDDTIELNVGLSVTGVYTPPATSWSMRAADFLAGCTDRGGATGALNENIYNALRLLDAKIQNNGVGNYVVLYSNLVADTTLTTLVPAGYMLAYAVFQEKSGNSGVLDLGTSAGGNEIFINQTITASVITTIVIERVFSFTAATTLYLNDDDAGSGWGGSQVDVYFVMIPIISSGYITGGLTIIGYYEADFSCGLPDNAAVEAVLGLATAYVAGSVFLIKDIGVCVTTQIYFIMSDGTDWYVNASVFEEAV